MSKQSAARIRKLAIFRDPRKSKLSLLLYSSISFGLVMGVVFPLYADFFVEWRTGLFVWFVIGCLVAGIIMGVVNFYMVNQIIIVPLRQVREVAVAVSKKDLTATCDIKSEDVIGDIADNLNSMLQSFENIVKSVASQASSVAQSSLTVSSLTRDVLENAVNQQVESKQSSHHITQMLERMILVNSNAVTAASNASSTEVSASEGGKALQESMESIASLADELDKASATMAALEKRSDSVGEVVKVISGIAEQTNLLALNAAIEAARAGEQGRGFAVVADEVRTLASRTRDSTQEIQSMIEELQHETKIAVSSMQGAKETAHHNTKAVSSVAEKLLSIIEAVKSIAEINREIESASTKQKESNEMVNTSVQNIMNMSDTVVENANESIKEIDSLTHLTSELQELISDFKLRNDA